MPPTEPALRTAVTGSTGPVVVNRHRIEPGTTWPARLKTPPDRKCQEYGHVGALLKQVMGMHEVEVVRIRIARVAGSE
jgi:hypothetical protein